MTDTLLERPTESPTPDLPTASTDAGAAPAAHSKRRSVRRRTWRNRVVVLAMVLIAGAAAVGLVRYQATKSAELGLGDLVLTSAPIPVETSAAGLVTSVDVHAGEHVSLGQQLGVIKVATTNSHGTAVVVQRTLRAPRAGIVVDEPLTLGSTLQPATAFAVLYDPDALTLVTDVPLKDVSQLTPGMKATLSAPGVVGTIRATLVRALPRVGAADADVAAGQLQLVFTPDDRAKVARLIPGMRFTGTIDTTTGRRGAHSAEYVN